MNFDICPFTMEIADMPFGIAPARTPAGPCVGFFKIDFKHETGKRFIMGDQMFTANEAMQICKALNYAYRLGKGTIDKFDEIP
jgi:hypothetical protein